MGLILSIDDAKFQRRSKHDVCLVLMLVFVFRLPLLSPARFWVANATKLGQSLLKILAQARADCHPLAFSCSKAFLYTQLLDHAAPNQ